MNKYQRTILKLKDDHFGSYANIGRLLGISSEAVRKWVILGRPPRTEYTGETQYAESLSRATKGKVKKAELLPPWPQK